MSHLPWIQQLPLRPLATLGVRLEVGAGRLEGVGGEASGERAEQSVESSNVEVDTRLSLGCSPAAQKSQKKIAQNTWTQALKNNTNCPEADQKAQTLANPGIYMRR